MEGPATGLTVQQLVRLNGKSTVKAICDVIIDHRFLVKGVRVVEGKQGIFVSMPRQQGKDGKWYDSVTALTGEAKADVSRAVLRAYEQKGSDPKSA